MRLDKYLKITRLIKRRTVANEACDAGRVSVNGKVARASYDVKEGDVIELNLGQKPLRVQVLKVSEYATKDTAAEGYGSSTEERRGPPEDSLRRPVHILPRPLIGIRDQLTGEADAGGRGEEESGAAQHHHGEPQEADGDGRDRRGQL